MSVPGMFEYVCMHACLYPNMHAGMHVCFYVNVNIYIYIYIYVCVCVCA